MVCTMNVRQRGVPPRRVNDGTIETLLPRSKYDALSAATDLLEQFVIQD
jgi:hypothetical protein